MVYRRGKRPSFYFEAKQRFGYKQLSTDTSDKRTAQHVEYVWAKLADKRAWDLLEPVVADLPKKKRERTHTIGRLVDLWDATKGNLEEMRQRARDVDVTPFVADWKDVMASQVSADWANHALAHVRHFFPEGTSRLASAVTADWLTTTLATYPGKRNTRRKVHSSLSLFMDYLTTTKRVWTANPMALVKRPAPEFVPPSFYDVPTVDRIVAWQPTEARQAFMALAYGAGVDVSPALLVDRADFNPATKEVRIAGTKTAYRDRIVRIPDRLWVTVWKYVKAIISGPVFPATWDRWTVSDWHRQTVGDGTKAAKKHDVPERKGLKLSKRLPLRKARHHFAVRLLESGAPVRVVAEQLGSDERTVLKHYGPWITVADDRARAEKMAQKHETKRREAK